MFVAALRRFHVGRLIILRFGLPISGALVLLATSALLSTELRYGIHALFPVR